MMVWWMCVLLKNKKLSEVLYSLLNILSVAEVVKHGRLRWFAWASKSEDDWVSACRNVGVAGEMCVGRGREAWRV